MIPSSDLESESDKMNFHIFKGYFWVSSGESTDKQFRDYLAEYQLFCMCPVLWSYFSWTLFCVYYFADLMSFQHFSGFGYLHKNTTVHKRVEDKTKHKTSSFSRQHLKSTSCTVVYVWFLSALALYSANSCHCYNPSIRTRLLGVSLWPNYLYSIQSKKTPRALFCCLQSITGGWRAHYHLGDNLLFSTR